MLDAHEYTHILDFRDVIPTEERFKLISFEASGKLRENATLEDHFFTWYAMTNHYEDLAETGGHSVSHGDHVREHLIGHDPLRLKYELIRDGALRRRDWTTKDVQDLEALA